MTQVSKDNDLKKQQRAPTESVILTLPGTSPGPSANEVDKPAKAPPLDPLDQMVSGHRLLEILWDAASRPSYRWLQYQCARRTIPFCKSGGRTWFVPRAVRDALTRAPVRRGRPAGS
jgi:hypothetical protein